ncbi:molybdenum cofactor guanylyltransferase [Robertkochia sediminum]|uniref:molybdenum cofactor guanylyltransferase n=1 Tax=Robertkochia sediminum TaxID=2785326 RepID=UPI001933455A|nr:molybdenum cofactor guanylyltransferase [Robertkochia sediminum]MBL7473028.1 molybdenum cofactor guanylyltransferase [Robertkochia sediminum]
MTSTAKLYGLVLAGGKSARMGHDKGSIDYHGMPQRTYMYKLLEELCESVYMSVRKDQDTDELSAFKCITDRDRYDGPFNGILSAHLEHPEVAWLVVACDMPLLNKQALSELITARCPEKDATSYTLKHRNVPEPLCAIWEPSGLERAIKWLEEGRVRGPQKFLLDAHTAMLEPENDRILINVNAPDEYRAILSKHARS